MVLLFHAFFKSRDLALGFVLLDPIALLQPSCQLLAAAVDGVDVVVGELAPLFLDLAFELRPLPLDDVFVHDVPSVVLVGMRPSSSRRRFSAWGGVGYPQPDRCSPLWLGS